MSTVQAIVEQGISAARSGQKQQAYALFVQALQQDPHNEIAWLWLSAAVGSKEEQRYCLERVLEINPQHSMALRGINGFSPAIVARAPFVMEKAIAAPQPVPRPVPVSPAPAPSKPAAPQQHPAPSTPQPKPTPSEAPSAPAVLDNIRPLEGNMLNPDRLSEHFGLTPEQVNRLFATLGWLIHGEDGWIPSEYGKALGAIQRVYPLSGQVFTIWPEGVLKHPQVRQLLRGPDAEPKPFRCIDGHLVCTEAEQRIDNWLFLAGIIHSYQHPLPSNNSAHCSFYVPNAKLYIDYIPHDSHERQTLYTKLRVPHLIINDYQISDLDEILPRVFLRLGIPLP
jgi:tetratricopeptide (TPR) repeat protein